MRPTIHNPPFRTVAVLVLAALALVACGGDESAEPGSTPRPVAEEGAPPAKTAAPSGAEESRLKTEAKEWTEQTRELGSAAVESSREALGDLSEKSGETWKGVKSGSAELYESAKARTGELYEAAKEKGRQAMDYVAEDQEQKKQEYQDGAEAEPAMPQ